MHQFVKYGDDSDVVGGYCRLPLTFGSTGCSVLKSLFLTDISTHGKCPVSTVSTFENLGKDTNKKQPLLVKIFPFRKTLLAFVFFSTFTLTWPCFIIFQDIITESGPSINLILDFYKMTLLGIHHPL